MKRLICWTILILLLAGCVSSEPTAPALTIPANTSDHTLAPPPPATPTQAPYDAPIISKIAPLPTITPTPIFRWLGQIDLVFQPGDLPEGVAAGSFSLAIPDVFTVKYQAPPDGAASLRFIQKGAQDEYGHVSLYYFKDAALLMTLGQHLIQSEEARRQGAPQAGIGELALLFPPEQPGRDTALFFRSCRTFIEIRLLSIEDPAIILRYGQRLSERIQQIDCQGKAAVPLQTPPSPLPTSTFHSAVPSAQGFLPNVQRLPDPEGANTIRSYAFPDLLHGWVALGARILATTDGGKTWQPQTTADSPVKQIVFQTDQEGWIETRKGFLVTQDGGGTWQRAATRPADPHSRLDPPPVTNAGPNLEESYPFCTGDTWRAGAFTAIDRQTGWAFCTSSPGDHFSFRKLFQTRDGGASWQLINADPPYNRWGISDLFFLDEKRGWMSLSEVDIYATQDGGKTWQPIGMDKLGSRMTGIHFLSPAIGFTILSNSSLNPQGDALGETRDGGKTWQAVYTAPPPAPWPDGPFQMFTDRHGIGSTGNSILTTSDSGQIWSQPVGMVSAPSCKFAIQITSLSFSDRDHGWATLICAMGPAPSAYSTADGGKTWQEHSGIGNRAGDGFVGVSFPNPRTGYLVTQAGYLYRTNDGGATFNLADPQSVHTSSFHFATADLGWELRGKALWQSTDGGRTWREIPFPLPVQYFALLADGQAWIVAGETTAENGIPPRRVFSTSNTGKTWAEHPFGEIPSNFNLPSRDAIQFADAQHGWLRGGNAFFYSSDGGSTWVQYH